MALAANYREIIKQIIDEYASYVPSHGQIETEKIIDTERDHYEVMHIGWDGSRRQHGTVLHIDLKNDKIWIQYDGTSRSVVDELLSKGISKESIVLGFYPREERQYT
ncbi:fatty-acid oxidation protein subunit alpha, partial [Candidatus Magnetomorum sp. HK-1]